MCRLHWRSIWGAALEVTGLVLRGLAAVLCEDRGGGVKFHGATWEANPIDFTVSRQRRVVRSISGAEPNGLVDNIEQLLLLQCALHRIYRDKAQSPERMIDLLQRSSMYPPLDICVDAKAVCDAMAAT